MTSDRFRASFPAFHRIRSLNVFSMHYCQEQNITNLIYIFWLIVKKL